MVVGGSTGVVAAGKAARVFVAALRPYDRRFLTGYTRDLRGPIARHARVVLEDIRLDTLEEK